LDDKIFCFEVICQEYVVKLQNEEEKNTYVGAPGLDYTCRLHTGEQKLGHYDPSRSISSPCSKPV